MAIIGIIEILPSGTYFTTTETLWTAPERRTDRWQISTERYDGWQGAQARLDGGIVTVFHSNGIGRAEFTLGNARSVPSFAPIAAPKVRGNRPVRWHEGRWEKLMARGWTEA